MSLVDSAASSLPVADRQAADKDITAAVERLWPAVNKSFAGQRIDLLSRSAIATRVGMVIGEHATDAERTLSLSSRRKVIDLLMGRLETEQSTASAAGPAEPISQSLS